MVAVSEAQLEVARKNLADAEVRAPFDGVVGERIANQGESLPIDGKIVALLDTSHVEIAAQMPAADVVRLKVGQPATVTPRRLRRARRSTAGSRASARRRRPARARSRSMSRSSTATRRCAAACSPRGTVVVKEKDHALAVPAAAMRKDDEGDFVLAVENGTLVRKPVGAVRTWSRGELVEVKGLEAGMTVVSAPLPGLKADRRSRSSKPDRRRR